MVTETQKRVEAGIISGEFGEYFNGDDMIKLLREQEEEIKKDYKSIILKLRGPKINHQDLEWKGYYRGWEKACNIIIDELGLSSQQQDVNEGSPTSLCQSDERGGELEYGKDDNG